MRGSAAGRKLAGMSYWGLLQLVLPVFALIGIGVALRRVEWVTEEADVSLLRLLVNFLYPCMILDSVLGNGALRSAGNLLVPPLVGFAAVAGGTWAAYQVAKAAGMQVGAGRRTFAFSCGIFNYAYIPIPLISALFGRGTLGVLFLHNIGCEAALWTIGILLLAGVSFREGWRRVINPPTVSLVAAVLLNFSGASAHLPSVILTTIHLSGNCAVPIGLILIGATLEGFLLTNPLALFDARATPLAWVLRLGVFPLCMLAAARWLPVSGDLRRVMVVEAAMPAGILPLVIAKHYGGQPKTAAQVIVGTTLAGLLVIPLWLKLGLSFVGG